ncbi:hypothetical protein [Cupriavidus basilensis]|uniref:Uncharacterized protein n=1 Tax=Cupriavidus basilensis TaxID=68895 RepID=A0A643FX66_9BURK|nr:hypothetical protein [Cupriavidus basilensis]QOT80096.1 hypothetical protein F7R26_021655 [Cupriavidus basilensis]
MRDFQIVFVSDVDREHLMAEISYRKQRFCLISKEGESEKMEIEFLTDIFIIEKSVVMKFPLVEFVDVLKQAEAELRRCI